MLAVVVVVATVLCTVTVTVDEIDGAPVNVTVVETVTTVAELKTPH